jgi:hypothetical protein
LTAFFYYYWRKQPGLEIWSHIALFCETLKLYQSHGPKQLAACWLVRNTCISFHVVAQNPFGYSVSRQRQVRRPCSVAASIFGPSHTSMLMWQHVIPTSTCRPASRDCTCLVSAACGQIWEWAYMSTCLSWLWRTLARCIIQLTV